MAAGVSISVMALSLVLNSCESCTTAEAESCSRCKDLDNDCFCTKVDTFFENNCLNFGNASGYDSGACSCQCIGNWTHGDPETKDLCSKCGISSTSCANGTFDALNCACICDPGWSGNLCNIAVALPPGAHLSFDIELDNVNFGRLSTNMPASYSFNPASVLYTHEFLDSVTVNIRLNEPGDTLKVRTYFLSQNSLQPHMNFTIEAFDSTGTGTLKQFDVIQGTVVVQQKTGSYIEGIFQGEFEERSGAGRIIDITAGEFWIRE